ncbi:glutathione S-transferase N-terminal domain-containing protein [Halothiobacillus sp. DCM-1]|uniref:glutathione S-transferase N-terminal domain-containing protein n=1 Tax=Halothiobacillus sp. DCM-1 TaxID=3112558 RepID=UPI0032497B98
MLTLYQFESCPFCWKVKALLHYAKIPYRIIEVNPMTSEELKPLGLKQVPVLVDDGEVIKESSVIVDYLNERYAKLPVTEDAAQWRTWVDQQLVFLLPPIIHKNFLTSWKTFGRVLRTSGFSPIKRCFVRLGGAVAMSRSAPKKAQARGISDAPAALQAAIRHWVDQGLAGRAFHGRDAPDLADLAVFAVLRATDGLVTIQLAEAASPGFAPWYAAMKTRTPSSASS